MATLYVVTGSTGSYDAFRTWNVAESKNRSEVSPLVDALNAWAAAAGVLCGAGQTFKGNRAALRCPLDPHMPPVDYTGVRWAICEVPSP
jgi:hypothetical protein